jgi:mono/diheme cytochrome c family protein
MMRAAGLGLALFLVAGAALGASAQTKLPNKVSIQIPPPERTFGPGPNQNIVMANCVVCHNADYPYNQGAMTRAQWTAEVNKMRGAYKANISEADVPKIVDYLMTINGKT